MRRLLLFLILLTVLLWGAGAQAAGTWRRGETMEPGSLDPHKATTVVEQRVLDELYEGLVVYDGEGRLQPGVAQSWDISADKTVYTFHLRADARWSDGSAVTADDFVFALRRLMDPRTGAQYASILYTLKNARAVNAGTLPLERLGVRAVDATTLELTLEHPAVYLLAQLTHFTALPLHRASLARWGASVTRAGHLVGNGAFRLVDHVPNDRLVLEKNPFFHAAAAVTLDREIILPMEDRSAGLRRFMAGEIDTYPDVPIDQISFIRARLGSCFKVAPNLGSYFWAFDTRHPPFNDARVRDALAMVIDRRFLAGTIWGGTMLPGFSFVPPGIAGYGAPATVDWKNESRFAREDEARRLLTAAGYGPDHPLRLSFRYNQSENNRATAIAVADMWRVLGVETRFIVTDANTHFAFLASGAPYDVIRSSWWADFPDAANFLFLGESENRGLNYAHYADPGFDALMRKAEAEGDAGTRTAILHQAERLLVAQQPYLTLMTFQASNLVSPALAGWSANILDHHPGRSIRKTAQPASFRGGAAESGPGCTIP